MNHNNQNRSTTTINQAKSSHEMGIDRLDEQAPRSFLARTRAVVVLLCIVATLTAGSAVYMTPSGPSLGCKQGTTWVSGKPVYTTGQISVSTGLQNELYVNQIAVMGWGVYRWNGGQWSKYSEGSQVLNFSRAYWDRPVIQLPMNLGGFPGGYYAVYLSLNWTENGTTRTWQGWLNGTCAFYNAG